MSTSATELFDKFFEEALNTTQRSSTLFNINSRNNLGTLVCRPIKDENGRPWRIIKGMTEVSIKDPLSETWERVKFMSPANYINRNVEISREIANLMNRVSEKAKRLHDEDVESKKAFKDQVFWKETKLLVMMYVKVQKHTPTALSDKYQAPSTEGVTLISSTSSAFIPELKSRYEFQLEPISTKEEKKAWIESVFGREVGPVTKGLMIKSSTKQGQGFGFNMAMNFLDLKGVEITQQDLDTAKDLYGEFVTEEIDKEKLEKVESLLDAEIENRKRISEGIESLIPKESGKVTPLPNDDFEFE